MTCFAQMSGRKIKTVNPYRTHTIMPTGIVSDASRTNNAMSEKNDAERSIITAPIISLLSGIKVTRYVFLQHLSFGIGYFISSFILHSSPFTLHPSFCLCASVPLCLIFFLFPDPYNFMFDVFQAYEHEASVTGPGSNAFFFIRAFTCQHFALILYNRNPSSVEFSV